MKALFDQVSAHSSRITTKAYSTSFSLSINLLSKKFRQPIYDIYGFVRLADEIVDSFHDYDKRYLLYKFKADTLLAISDGISLNPILNSFQHAVNEYNIEWELIESFLNSMEMDLNSLEYDQSAYENYILGSAEVVGLMCLRVFTEGDEKKYKELRPFAMRLGSAFQKVNFLRDAQEDFEGLGRTYFPGIDMASFSNIDKKKIESEIEEDFHIALQGIKGLPPGARRGVYLAYFYYLQLFRKIKLLPANRILQERIRIPNGEKIGLMLQSVVRHQLNLL